MRRTFLFLAAVVLLPAHAFAQTSSRISAGIDLGVARTWTDESLAGAGLVAGGRAGFDLTDRTSLELSVTRIAHDRDFEGSPVSVSGRSLYTGLTLKHDFARGAARPFIVAGYGINQYESTWVDPAGRRSYSSVDHGYNAGGGIVFRRGRWEHGPEARVHMLSIEADTGAAVIITGAYRLTARF